VAVKKLITEEWKIVNHVPRRISPLSWVFIRGSGKIKCNVTGPQCYSSDLPKWRIAGTVSVYFSADDAKKCELLHKRIIASLLKTCHDESLSSDVVGVIEAGINEIVDINEPMSSGENAILVKVESEDTSNTSAMPNRCQDSYIEEVVVPEEVVCSPPKNKPEERVLTGEELSDHEINFVQQLLKQQFGHINGLCSTLLQDKDEPYNLTTTTLSNRMQIIVAGIG